MGRGRPRTREAVQLGKLCAKQLHDAWVRDGTTDKMRCLECQRVTDRENYYTKKLLRFAARRAS